MSARDAMETDWHILLVILSDSSENPVTRPEVKMLGEFVGML